MELGTSAKAAPLTLQFRSGLRVARIQTRKSKIQNPEGHRENQHENENRRAGRRKSLRQKKLPLGWAARDAWAKKARNPGARAAGMGAQPTPMQAPGRPLRLSPTGMCTHISIGINLNGPNVARTISRRNRTRSRSPLPCLLSEGLAAGSSRQGEMASTWRVLTSGAFVRAVFGVGRQL